MQLNVSTWPKSLEWPSTFHNRYLISCFQFTRCFSLAAHSCMQRIVCGTNYTDNKAHPSLPSRVTIEVHFPHTLPDLQARGSLLKMAATLLRMSLAKPKALTQGLWAKTSCEIQGPSFVLQHDEGCSSTLHEIWDI